MIGAIQMEWILSHWMGHINGVDALLWTGLAVLHHYCFRVPQTAAQAAESPASQTRALPRVLPSKALRMPRVERTRTPRDFRPEPATLRVRDAATRRAEARGRWADVLDESDAPSAPTRRDQRLAA